MSLGMQGRIGDSEGKACRCRWVTYVLIFRSREGEFFPSAKYTSFQDLGVLGWGLIWRLNL